MVGEVFGSATVCVGIWNFSIGISRIRAFVAKSYQLTAINKKTPHCWRAFSLKIYKQHLLFMNVARFDVGALGNY